jgi:hypothetical protein
MLSLRYVTLSIHGIPKIPIFQVFIPLQLIKLHTNTQNLASLMIKMVMNFHLDH